MDIIIGAEWLGPAGFAVASGLALAATCGLRTFLPVLAVSLLGFVGLLPLSEATPWLASVPAVVVFGALAALELAADKVPGIDHHVDAVGFALKPVAAMLVAIGVMHGTEPWTAGLLGVAAGGTAATVLGVGKAKLRLLSTATTRGVGNIPLSVLEDGAAILCVGLAVVAPPVAAVVLGVLAAGMAAAGSFGRRARWAHLARA